LRDIRNILLLKNFPGIYKIISQKRKTEQKLETPQTSDKQLEKMTFYGYGYRYPSLVGQPMEEITYKTKRGTRTKRYPKPTPEWEAVYELNKQVATNNSWIKFLGSKMPELKKEYYAEKAEKGLIGLKGKYYASKISPEIEKNLVKMSY
jgi:hypothetical protein